MAHDAAHHQVVLFGGEPVLGPAPGRPCSAIVPCSGSGTVLTDTWMWDGHDWHLEHPRHHPAAGLVAGMAADTAAGRLILVEGGPGPGTGLVPGDGAVSPAVDAPAVGTLPGEPCAAAAGKGRLRLRRAAATLS